MQDHFFDGEIEAIEIPPELKHLPREELIQALWERPVQTYTSEISKAARPIGLANMGHLNRSKLNA